MISGRRRWLLVATLCLACGWLGVVWLNHAATVGRAREEYSLFHRRHFPAQDPRVDVVQPEVIAVERPPLRQLNQQRSSAGKTDQQQQQPQQHKLVDAAAQTVAPQSTTSATTTSGLVPVGDNSKDNGNNDAGESAQQVVVVDESAGNDEDDAEANDIQVAAQSPEPQPTAATETSPPVRIMILVITGGTKPSVVTNRQAVAKTWADNDTYFVTHDKVPSGSNVLWLPDAAEAPGGSILSRKVLHMWEHVADKYLDRYDFFMKADDDTYINMPLLRHNLQQVDPQLPLYMGAKHFGVIIKGTPAPNLLWQAKNYMKFAHGGAGYILSRGALKMLGAASFRKCMTKPPMMSLEDARVASCVYRFGGIDAIDLSSASFGTFDVFHNRHEQAKHMQQLSATPPVNIALGGTFHSVEAEVQHAIHRIIFRDPKLMSTALFAASKNLATVRVRGHYRFVTAWHCQPGVYGANDTHATSTTAGYPNAEAAVLQRDQPTIAMCQASIFKQATILKEDVVAAMAANLNLASAVVLQSGTRTNDATAQISSDGCGLPIATAKTSAGALPQAWWAPNLRPDNTRCTFAATISSSTQVLAVRCHDSAAVTAAMNMFRQLRLQLRSCATIILFYPQNAGIDDPREAMAEFAPLVAVPVSDRSILEKPAAFGLALAAALAHWGISDTAWLVVLPADAFLQRDPFTMLTAWDGVALFMAEPLVWWTASRCHVSWPNQLAFTTIIHPWVAVGRAGAVRRYMLARHAFISIRTGPGRCGEVALLSEAVWHQYISPWVPIAIISPYDGPVGDATSGPDPGKRWWSLHRAPCGLPEHLSAVNRRGEQLHVLLGSGGASLPAGTAPTLLDATSPLLRIVTRVPPDRSPNANVGGVPSKANKDTQSKTRMLPKLDPDVERAVVEALKLHEPLHAAGSSVPKQVYAMQPKYESAVRNNPSVVHRQSSLGYQSKSAKKFAGPEEVHVSRREVKDEEITSGPSLVDNATAAAETEVAWPVRRDEAKQFLISFQTAVPQENVLDGLTRLLAGYHEVFASDASRPRQLKVASPKMHKTGSSTLSGILFRVGGRHKLRIYPGDSKWSFLDTSNLTKLQPAQQEAFDLEFHHLSPNGNWRGKYSVARAFYRHIIGPTVATITVVREPLQQLASWASYYYVPQNRAKFGGPEGAFENFVRYGSTTNMLASEFGLYNDVAVEEFIRNELPTFDLIMISERFDEGLVMLRRMFNWDLLDILYLRLLDSHSQSGSVRWDGRRIDPTPKVGSLAPELQELLRQKTHLDEKIYRAVVNRFEAQLQDARADPSFQRELQAFATLQQTLSDACEKYPRHPTCLYFKLDDLEYFRLVSPAGHAPHIDFRGEPLEHWRRAAERLLDMTSGHQKLVGQ